MYKTAHAILDRIAKIMLYFCLLKQKVEAWPHEYLQPLRVIDLSELSRKAQRVVPAA